MNMRRLSVALLSLLALCGAGAVRADDNEESVSVRSAEGAPLDFRLIQVSAFNPSITVSNAGTDQLAQNTNNHLAVLNDRTVQIEFHPVVTQAPSPLTYKVWFCRFGAIFGPAATGSGCVALLDPASTATPKAPLVLTVDANGTAKGTAVFPALAADAPAGSDVWSGGFVITRDITSGTNTAATVEFVNAFEFSSAPEQEQQQQPGQPGATEIQLSGQVSSIDVPNQSFLIGGAKVVVNDSTRFEGRYKSLSELAEGMRVVVNGVLQTDSATSTSFVVADTIRWMPDNGNNGKD